jgi:ribosomal protein S27AE
MRKCQYSKCDIAFEEKTHNQLYHDSECTRLATNERIMENYYKRKERLKGGKRDCSRCGTQLSRYNSADICGACHMATNVSPKDVLNRLLEV